MKYRAIYFRHFRLICEEYNNLKEAVGFLVRGEEYGELSSVGIADGEGNYCPVMDDGYDWGKGPEKLKIALERLEVEA